MWDWFKEQFETFTQWLMDLLLWLPRKLYELLTESLADVFDAIPVPSFITNLASWFSGIDPGIAYFLAPLNFGTGLGIIVAAYLIRFLIRRIPVIG